jgi:hypothetical protein
MIVHLLPSSRRLIGALLSIAFLAFAASGSPCLGAGSAGEWQNLAGPQHLSSPYAAYDAARHRMIFASSNTQRWLETEVWTLSTLDASTWTQIQVQPWPPATWYGSIVFDPVRDRLLLFGGYDNGGVSSDTWELSLANPSGWQLLETATTTRPSGRSAHAAIYDPVGDRMIVFGGYGDSPLQDTWALSLSGSVEWQLLSDHSPAGSRFYLAAVHDPVRHRMIVYGGVTNGGVICEDGVWALALSGAPAWSQVASVGPGRRYSTAAAYDSDQDRLLVFGGRKGPSEFENDVWSLPLSGGSWTQLSIGGIAPTPRSAAGCAFDPDHDRLLLHGGGRGQATTFVDSWSLALAGTPAWTKISDPMPRSGATAVLDEPRARMIVFGGTDPYTTELKDDLWAYSSASDDWQRIDAGAGPLARTEHAAFYDPVRDRTWMFGGSGPAYRNDLWSLAPSGEGLAWQPVDAGPAPEPRASHTLVYDPRRDRALLFGGRGELGRFNDVWELSLSGTPTWSRLDPSGTPPPARYDHVAIYDPYGDRMIVFSGMGHDYLQDVWALELADGPRWIPLGAGYPPPVPIFALTAILDPVENRMVIFGPMWASGEGYYGLWELSLIGPTTWTKLDPAGVAHDETQYAAIYDPSGDRMLVFGEGLQALEWTRDYLAEAPRREAGLELYGVCPNPLHAGLGTVSFTLPDAAPARLELIDVAGRVVLRQDVGHLGAGRHDVALRGRSLAAGVFWLRLTRAHRSVASRVVVTR